VPYYLEDDRQEIAVSILWSRWIFLWKNSLFLGNIELTEDDVKKYEQLDFLNSICN